MRTGYVLAIDQGTTNTKALLVDESGATVARASRSLAQAYPRPGWVEQDPAEIWASVRGAVADLLAAVPASASQVRAIGLSNQREATILWERASGRALGPVVGWQCHRTAPLCEDLRARGLEPLLRERTGLTVDPMFSATKARWLLDNTPDGQRRAEAAELCVGTMDSWLLWNLTGGRLHACDVTNASRTQLFGLRSLAWDHELLDLFGLPASLLPEVRPSSGPFGEAVALGDLGVGAPIAGVIGDSHGAMFGHASFAAGAVKATYGTGSSLMAPTAGVVTSRHGISGTVAWELAGQPTVYALEGNIYATGAAVQWLGEALSLPEPGSGIESLAGGAVDNGGVYFVPAFAGLGAPHWNADARALFAGITRGTTAAHLARAAIEAIAYQVRDVFDAMQADYGRRLEYLLADGGASRNEALMQFQADLLDRPVLRSTSAELSALGAAYLAGLGSGLWSDLGEVERLAQPRRRFEPTMPASERERLYSGWRDALARATLATGAVGGMGE